MFCRIIVATSSGSNSPGRVAVQEDKVCCIGNGIYGSERTGRVVR